MALSLASQGKDLTQIMVLMAIFGVGAAISPAAAAAPMSSDLFRHGWYGEIS